VAHEAAHQWWGDLITMRTWSETWLNESFATYSEYRYALSALGADEGAVNLLAKKNDYLNEARTRYVRPIVFDRYRFPNDNFDRHTYQKGAAVLNMLRFVVGDRPFHNALALFLRRHAFKPAATADLIRAFKDATGQDLKWFFDEWIYRPGHPVFKISSSWNAAAAKLTLRVEQVQDPSKGIPTFRMPVIIGIDSAAGRTQHKVWLKEKVDEFDFDVASRPLMVRFDVGNHLLKEESFEKSVEELIYQFRHDDVIGRMWAATELGRFAGQSAVWNALLDGARSDPFWAVRRSAVDAIGKTGDERAIATLKEKAADSSSKVRVAALAALGNSRKAELVAFFRERFERDDSYLAQAEALRGIGKCGLADSLPILEAAAKTNSPRDVLKNAAEWATREIARKPR
jgi:aminopeptidase N